MSMHPNEPAPFLDLTEDQRKANKAHVAGVTETVRKVALDLPLSADVDDFRSVLVTSAPKGGRS
jgi:hypothetical protein